MKDVQCYELFGGIALKIHTFSFSMQIKSLAQGENILMRGLNRQPLYPKFDILTTTPIVHL